MKWSLLELNKYKEEPLKISETFELTSELKARESQLLDVSPITVNGLLTVGKEEYLLYYTMEVTLTVPSSRSLTPVPLPMVIEVNEVFMTKEQFEQKDETISDEEVIILEKPTIDLVESVVDNILLAIPLQVLSKEELESAEMPKGEGWEVVSEEEFIQRKDTAQEQTTDPRLAKLSELFSDSAKEDDEG